MRQLRLLFVLLFCTVVVTAQTPFKKEFWLNESNIPVRVNDLLYCSTGYLWLATDVGLYRFNGRSFTFFADSLKLPVTAVSEGNGVVYVGYKNGGIGIVSHNAVVPLNIENQHPTSTITSIKIKAGLLYITTEDEGVFVVVNKSGLQMTTKDGLTDNFIYDALIADDELVLGTDRGVNHIRMVNGKAIVEVFTTANGLPDNIVKVIKGVPGTKLAWVGTQQGGLALYDDNGETFRQFKMSSEWAWGQINDILPISGYECWVATEEGYLLHIERKEDLLDIEPVTYEGIKLLKITRDKTGNIWCATNRGLMVNSALYTTSLKLPASYQLRDVTAITCDKDNNLWFTQNDQLYKMPLGSTVPQFMEKTAASITCLFADSARNLWVGTFGKGLFRYSHNKLTPITNIKEIIDGHILSVAAIRDHIWIASLNGVEEAVLDSSAGNILQLFKHHNKLSGTGSDYVYQLYPDRKGRMWLATDGGGVCMIDNGGYRHWGAEAGFKSHVVYCITEDTKGAIWAGTLENGLFRYDGKGWQQFGRRVGLQNVNIYALRGTATGEVVVVNEEAIDEWYPGSHLFRHFNRRLGMDIDSTLTIPNCIASDTSGNVYVPFEHGFIVFKNQYGRYDISPSVHINSISLFSKPLITNRVQFDHDENHISFRYEGINFSNPERLHYRYKLENYDSSWTYTNDEVIPFAQLPPGRYVFHVQASLNDDFRNSAEDTYAFAVVKPIWTRTWFVILVAIGLAGAGYGYIRVREKNLKNMSRLQRERMVFEYEHLKSQVNPHFLFNSLNTLVSLIEENRNAAVDYTVHLSDLYRNMLSYKDQDLISLSEEYEIIINYMHIQKSRFGEALKLNAEIPEHLFKTKKIVPLALQLLVENAIKHNIVSLSTPLVISIIATEQEIQVRNIIQPKVSKEKGAGLGLVNIKRRYSLITSRDTSFGVEGKEYVVTLPLL